MFTTTLIPDEHPKKNGRLDMLSRFQRLVCILSVLLTAFCFLRCIASYENALQDMHTFKGLGFPYPIQYYLEENSFLATVGQFLLVVSEFTIYIILYLRISQRKSFRGCLVYFYIMLAIHAAAWFHANSLVKGYPPPTSANEVAIHYRTTANISILPASAYSILYSFRVARFRQKPEL